MGKTELNSNQKNKKAKAKMYYKNISKREKEKGKDFGGGGRWKRGQSGWIPGGTQLGGNWEDGSSNKGRSRMFFTTGMKGFLCTTNMREGKCVIEAYNILNEYAPALETNTQNKLIGSDEDNLQSSDDIVSSQQESDNATKNDIKCDIVSEVSVPNKTENENKAEIADGADEIDMDDEDDIDNALSKEIKDLKSCGSTRRFQSVDTGVKNVLFINTPMDDPKSLSETIYDDFIAKNQAKCRHLLRFIPIAMTCKPSLEDIKENLKSILPKYFEGGFKSFKVEYNCRCNSKLEVSRGSIITIVNEIINEINPMTFVDLHNPLYTVYVDVVNSVVCLSVLSNFSKYRKYNLVEVAIPRPQVSTEKSKTTNETQAVSVGDGENQTKNLTTDGDEKQGNQPLETA